MVNEMPQHLAPDIAKTGYLACDGDEDWYRLEVPGRFILNHPHDADYPGSTDAGAF